MRSSAAEARSCADLSAVTAALLTLVAADSPNERMRRCPARRTIGEAQSRGSRRTARTYQAREEGYERTAALSANMRTPGKLAPPVKVAQRRVVLRRRGTRVPRPVRRARAAPARPSDRRRGRARFRRGRPPSEPGIAVDSRRRPRTGASRVEAVLRDEARCCTASATVAPGASSTGTMSCTLGVAQTTVTITTRSGRRRPRAGRTHR